MLRPGPLPQKWTADLQVDQRVLQLLKGLQLDLGGSRGNTSGAASGHSAHVLLTCSKTGLKWSAFRAPHGLSAHLFLPRTTFRSYLLVGSHHNDDAGDETIVICICLAQLLEVLAAELTGASRIASVNAAFSFSDATDHLTVALVGLDGCRVQCRLATFDPHLAIDQLVNDNIAGPGLAGECRIMCQAEQFRAIFAGEVALRTSDRVTLQAGNGSGDSRWLRLQLVDSSITGREQIVTFSGALPNSALKAMPSWWESFSVEGAAEDSTSIVCRTDWLQLAASVASVADRVAIRWLPGILCEVQLLAGGLPGDQPGFLHYRGMALVQSDDNY